jgi:hypothetical protein
LECLAVGVVPRAAPFRRTKEIAAELKLSEENSCVPAVRFVGLQSFICQPTCELLGYSQHLAAICFHIRRGLLDQPSPESLDPGSFSHVLSPLRSSFANSSRLPLSRQPILLGFLPFARHRRSRPPTREYTFSRYVPPTGFLNLSTACSASGFAGLLHPAATCRVLSVQGFLPIRSRPDSSPGCAPMPLPSRPLAA